MTSGKITEYETYLNEVLREKLKHVLAQRETFCQEILELEQLKTVIERLQEAELTKQTIKTRVDLGCNFYVQANVTDTRYIFVKTGLDIFVQFTLEEATKFIDRKVEFLNKKVEKTLKTSSEINAHIQVVLQGLRELQNLNYSSEPPRPKPRSREGLTDDDTDCYPRYKPSVEVDDSDSSDCEVPKFSIPAFRKFATEVPNNSTQVKTFHNKSIKLSSSMNAGEGYNKSNYINMNVDKASPQNQSKDLQKVLDKTLEKSVVCQPGFEKLEKVPTFLSKRQKTKLGLKERDKTKGFNWFGMAAPEMTEEKKNDLLVVQMRQALDPKHFYKRSATKTTPKYFQVGTFVENPIDFYSSRVPKKQRKQTLVDELLADAEFRQYQKKKFSEIQRAQPPKFVHRKKLTHSRRVEAREARASKKPKKGKKKT